MARILDRVNQPSDLKNLSVTELEILASEVRKLLVDTVSITGGHLASNLGVVELTIALHTVFDSPSDKLIWDVGHQSYVHKMLTGRKDSFFSLRQEGGISGFTDRSESIHDQLNSGHASTSISSALGMAVARDLLGDDYHVIAIIGDGSLTGGMAFEAINQAGHLGKRLIVILNDNGMAISPSVGAFSRWSNKLRFDSRYQKLKDEAEELLPHLPFGNKVYSLTSALKRKFKSLVLPTMLWEELGFSYMGPLNGHNISELMTALNKAKTRYKKPTLIHIYTTKGKGYLPAEKDCITYHGIAPNGGTQGENPTYSNVFGNVLIQLMDENPKIVAITAAMKEGTGLDKVAKKFPERVFDVGICEQHAVTFAGGLASQGLIPVVAIYSTFLQRGFDQIIHDVCLQELPVIFAIDRAGIVGEDGKTHQGSFDLSYLSLIPGLVVAAPKDANELKDLLYTATKIKKPMAIRYPRGKIDGEMPGQKPSQIEIGQGELLKYGSDIAIIAIGDTVTSCLSVGQYLGELGLDCAVLNARFLKPLDEKLILQVSQMTTRLVTVEENSILGGLGSSVATLLHIKKQHHVTLKSIGLPDAFIEHGSQTTLRNKYGLDPQGIIKQIFDHFPELVGEDSLVVKKVSVHKNA